MKPQRGEAWIVMVVVLAIMGVLVLMFGLPVYSVWQQGLAGEAELKRAEQNRKIKILEAQARMESAEFDNKAEVKRAEGVAMANKIVADGLGGPEGYLRYLWIQGLQTNQMQVLYIPTEAGLPILEAGRGTK